VKAVTNNSGYLNFLKAAEQLGKIGYRILELTLLLVALAAFPLDWTVPISLGTPQHLPLSEEEWHVILLEDVYLHVHKSTVRLEGLSWTSNVDIFPVVGCA